MSYPVGWDLVNITGTYIARDGTPCTGSVTLSSPQLVLRAGTIVPAADIVFDLVNGAFSGQIPATDDPNANPTGWVYTVTENVPGGRQGYQIVAPHTSPGIDLSTVVPVTMPMPPTFGFPYVTLAQLAGTAVGDGAYLIGYQNAATGGAAQTVQAKLQQTVSAKDFGAIGDNNSHPLSGIYATLAAAQAVYPFVTSLTQELDWAAIQAAINALPDGGIVLLHQGTFLINTALGANVGVILEGQSVDDVSSNPNGSGQGFPRIRWSGGVSSGAMFNLFPSVAGNIVWGGGTRNIFWDGAANVANGVLFNNTTQAVFSGDVRNVTFAGVVLSSDSGTTGAFSSNNFVEYLGFTWGTVAACQNAHGLMIRGNNGTVSGTQQQVARVNGLVYNGSLVYIQETDNCHFGAINCAVQSGGTGHGLNLHAGGAQLPNFNVFEYVNGPVLQDNGVLGTTIKHYISEGGGITQSSGSSVWDGWLTDYVTGKRFASHVYQLRKKIGIPSGAFIGTSGTSIVSAALVWPLIALPSGASSTAAAVLAPDYDCDVGEFTGAELRFISNGTSAGTASFNFLLSSVPDGNKTGFVTPQINQNVIPTVAAQYTEFVVTVTFGTPLATANGDSWLVGVVRNNAGTNTDPIMLLGVRLLWQGVGPNSAGSGTYYIPNW